MLLKGIRAKLQAGINLKPEKSQIFVLALLVISAVCLIVGFIFLWFNHQNAWIPLLIGFAFAVGSCIAWNISYKNIDYANATPTRFHSSEGEIDFTTDTRALTDQSVFMNLEKLFSLMAHREPLPEPDGLVNDDGTPLAYKKKEAVERVNKANESAKDIITQAISSFSRVKQARVTKQPQLEEPGNEILLKINIPLEDK